MLRTRKREGQTDRQNLQYMLTLRKHKKLQVHVSYMGGHEEIATNSLGRDGLIKKF